MLRWTLRQLQSGSSETRIRAAEKLGNSRNEQVVDALVAVLKDENLDVRKAAAEALGKIGNLRAVEPLAATLQDNARDLLVAGLATSRYVGISDKHHLQMRRMWLLKVRKEAAKALAKIGGSQSIEMLSTALQSDNSDVRLAALDALVGISSPSVDDLLLTTLKDEVAVIRAMSASALGARGDPRAVVPLIGALQATTTMFAVWQQWHWALSGTLER